MTRRAESLALFLVGMCIGHSFVVIARALGWLQ